MIIVAIKDMSAGNETIGETWQETKVFQDNEPISEVIAWVANDPEKYGLGKRVTLTVPKISETVSAEFENQTEGEEG